MYSLGVSHVEPPKVELDIRRIEPFAVHPDGDEHEEGDAQADEERGHHADGRPLAEVQTLVACLVHVELPVAVGGGGLGG